MLKQTQKTNGGMPPQFHPLEVRGADTRKGKARNGLGHTAAFQPSREETTGSAKPVASPASAESGVSRVFVLDAKGNPLMPCHPARARRFLKSKRARVHKMFPFTIRLVDRTRGDTQPCRLKFDPGAKVTGIAIVRESGDAQHVLHLAEVEHRGNQIHRQIQQRSNYRRRRRSTNLRYRKPRFNNRTRPKGWLPPSLKSRVDNCLSWTSRYLSICPASALSLERVRFDTQKMENPELSGVEYQQGELSGYEVREYLLEKWGRKCAYCGAKNVPLEVEHIRPKSKGGSNRISNLTLSCKACNQAKGNMPIEDR
jgi:5-methylcytosine-specific restriction endonuclease McrA